MAVNGGVSWSTFEKQDLIFRAGQVTSIPNNTYASDFKFEVQGTTGNEMVFAFASSQGSTLVAVTHDHDILGRFDRAIDFKAYQSTADVAA